MIATSAAATRAALAAAAEFARGLGARVTLVAAAVAPYPLPLEKPPVDPAFTRRALAALAAGQCIEVAVEMHLCRDRREALRQILKPESIVILGGRRRWWWPTAEQRLASHLRRICRHVILVPTNRPAPLPSPAQIPAEELSYHAE